jgi:hypothetical protein
MQRRSPLDRSAIAGAQPDDIQPSFGDQQKQEVAARGAAV